MDAQGSLNLKMVTIVHCIIIICIQELSAFVPCGGNFSTLKCLSLMNFVYLYFEDKIL